MAVYPRGRTIEPDGFTSPASARQRADRLSPRVAILCIGFLSLGAWVVILALLHALG